MKRKSTLLSVATTLIIGLSLSSFASADSLSPNSATTGSSNNQVVQHAGKPLNSHQTKVKKGESKILSEIHDGQLKNLGQVISQEVKLHEDNGYKFGGINWAIVNAKDNTETKYSLSGSKFNISIYSYDSQNETIGKLLTQKATNFDLSNQTKFSNLVPELMKYLNNIPLKKSHPKANKSVAHAATATPYDGWQSGNYLDFYQTMYYFGSGYHDVDIQAHASWTDTTTGDYSDAGPKDGMDISWNQNNLYMGSVVWQPNTPTTAGPFSMNGVHDIAIDKSTEHYGSQGGYYIEPDNCSKTQYLEVYLYPVSSSVYGQTSNYYSNYIHSWNWLGGSGIGFGLTIGAFSVTWSSTGTHSYRVNNVGTYTI